MMTEDAILERFGVLCDMEAEGTVRIARAAKPCRKCGDTYAYRYTAKGRRSYAHLAPDDSLRCTCGEPATA